MKKIFLVLFILASVLMISFSVSAQSRPTGLPPGYISPTPVPEDIPIPDPLSFASFFNCGQAGFKGKDSCCKVYVPPPITQPKTGTFLDTIQFLLGNAYSNIKTKWWDPIQSLFINTITTNSVTCYIGVQSTDNSNDPSCKCIDTVKYKPNYLEAMNAFCQKQSKTDDRTACLACANDGGVFSGIGCIKTDASKFIQETVFGLGIGLAGGFSLLCIIYAAFMMQSSQGNPEKLKKAQEMITSCIMGLMLIIFSVFILKLIGVNILKIQGFQ